MKDISDVKDLPRKFLIFILLILSLFTIGTVGFMIIKDLSFSSALMRTLETLAFMFKDDTGIVKFLEIFLALFGVMLIWWIFWTSFDILISGGFSEYLKTRKFLSIITKMRNHYIIAGGGRVGEEIARELIKKKKSFIIIEKDKDKVLKLRKMGFLAIQGDVTEGDSSDLIKAGIKNAKVIILAMPETEKNLLMTMTSKELNPKIDVLARADNPAFVSKLKKAGAKVVIVPEIAAADKMISELF